MTSPNHVAPRAYEVRLEFSLGAPVAKAWRALTEQLDQWWPRDFRTMPDGQISLEFRLGGALSERPRDPAKGLDGLVWYQLLSIESEHSLLLQGFIAPPFGGPALSLLRLTLEPVDAESCTLLLRDSLLGVASPTELESGWRGIVAGLQTHLRSSRA